MASKFQMAALAVTSSSPADNYAEQKLERLRKIRLLKQRRSSSLSVATQKRLSEKVKELRRRSTQPDQLPGSLPPPPSPTVLSAIKKWRSKTEEGKAKVLQSDAVKAAAIHWRHKTTESKEEVESKRPLNKSNFILNPDFISLDGADPMPGLPSPASKSHFTLIDSDEDESGEENKSDSVAEYYEKGVHDSYESKRPYSLPDLTQGFEKPQLDKKLFDFFGVDPLPSMTSPASRSHNLFEVDSQSSDSDDESTSEKSFSFKDSHKTQDNFNNKTDETRLESKNKKDMANKIKIQTKMIHNQKWALRYIFHIWTQKFKILKSQAFKKWIYCLSQVKVAKREQQLEEKLKNMVNTARLTSVRFARDKFRHVLLNRQIYDMGRAFERWKVKSWFKLEIESLRRNQTKLRLANASLQGKHLDDINYVKKMTQMKRQTVAHFMFYRWKIWYQARIIELQYESMKKERKQLLSEIVHIQHRVETMEHKSFTKFIINYPQGNEKV